MGRAELVPKFTWKSFLTCIWWRKTPAQLQRSVQFLTLLPSQKVNHQMKSRSWAVRSSLIDIPISLYHSGCRYYRFMYRAIALVTFTGLFGDDTCDLEFRGVLKDLGLTWGIGSQASLTRATQPLNVRTLYIRKSADSALCGCRLCIHSWAFASWLEGCYTIRVCMSNAIPSWWER